MTKEERAIKWFSKVDQNQEIDLKTKMKICDMAAMIMLLIIFSIGNRTLPSGWIGWNRCNKCRYRFS